MHLFPKKVSKKYQTKLKTKTKTKKKKKIGPKGDFSCDNSFKNTPMLRDFFQKGKSAKTTNVNG